MSSLVKVIKSTLRWHHQKLSRDKVRFPEQSDTTKQLTLKKDGSFETFEISGETKSNAKEDATIEVRHEKQDGSKLGEKKVTVFHFLPSDITVARGSGSYSIISNAALSLFPKPAVRYVASARLKPDGLDLTVPQLKDLKIGISQNVAKNATSRVRAYKTPSIQWDPAVPAGTTVVANKEWQVVTSLSQDMNDSEASVAPFMINQIKPSR